MKASDPSADLRLAVFLLAVLLAAFAAATHRTRATLGPSEEMPRPYASFRLAAVPELVGGGPARTCAIRDRRDRDAAIGMSPRITVARANVIGPLPPRRRPAAVDGSDPCGGYASAPSSATTSDVVSTRGTTRPLSPWTSSGLALSALTSATIGAVGAAGAASRRLRRRLAGLADVCERAVAEAFVETCASPSPADPMDRIERALRELPSRLSAVREQVRHTVAIVAHDLRTPLCRMRARLRRALASEALSEGLVEEAVADCDGLDALLDSLLAISSLERGEGRSRFEILDLGELAEVLTEAYEPAVSDGGRTIRLRRALDGPATAMGDRILLMQAAANLLDNALLHTPPGTAVSLGVGTEGGDAVLSVSDDGPGAAPADLARLAEPFFRAHRADDGSGHGLGLAMAAATARAHGGRMEVEDADPGLRVRLLLPRAA